LYRLKCNPVGETAHNKRFSEMAVGVETGSFLLPLNVFDSSRYGAPNLPLRQAAGRYVIYTLLRWCAEEDFIGII